VQQQQGRWMDVIGVLDPVIALRRVSMGLARTDLFAYQLFTAQAEAYRYALVQALNHLQVEEINYADDRNPQKQNRLSHQHWHAMPVFEETTESTNAMLVRIAPYLGVLLLWCGCLISLLPLAARRLSRSVS
jgi:ABC-2 type transport system permease protein